MLAVGIRSAAPESLNLDVSWPAAVTACPFYSFRETVMMKLVRFADAARLAGALVVLAACGAHADSKSPAAAPAPAAASAPQVGTEPQVTAASYGDWTVRCQRVGDGAQSVRMCEIDQSMVVQGQQTPIAAIAVGRPGVKDPLHVTVQFLNNVSFPSSVKLSVDDKDTQPIDVPWLRCLPGGCIATLELKDDDIKRWKAQTGNGRMLIKTGDGHDLPIPFSFRGFAQAMDGLAKTAP